jgi:hypothetical protein
MICSSTYVAKAEKGEGGAGYERLIVTAEVVANIDTIKFIPILRGPLAAKKTPSFLGPKLYIDFNSDAEYETSLLELVSSIHGVPLVRKPAVGPNPFSGMPPAVVPATRPGVLGRLGNQWFLQEHAQSVDRFHLQQPELTAHMELRAGLVESIAKSQIELLNAVRRSEIQTFWLANRHST